MEFTSYNAELALAQLLFQRVFSNIQIERTDSKGQKSWLKVPCVNATRSRIIKNLENNEKKSTIRLPMIAFSRTGYTRSGDRLNSLHNEVKYEISQSNRNYSYLTPVPVDISFDLTVFAKYQADIDKIASNFMVFFNNDIYVSQEHPKFQGIKLNNQIVMSDGVSEEHPDEFDGSQDDLITSTFQFTFKTYLFGGTKQAALNRRKQLSTYLSTYIAPAVYEFQSDAEVLEYLKSASHQKLSTLIQSELTTEVSTYIDISSESEYDDGIPKVRNISFGFYSVPLTDDIDSFIASVDNELFVKHEHLSMPTYISSQSYVSSFGNYVDDEGNQYSKISSISGICDTYDIVDNWCTLAPYVDRIKWVIDQSSQYPFPYNVRPRSC